MVFYCYDGLPIIIIMMVFIEPLTPFFEVHTVLYFF